MSTLTTVNSSNVKHIKKLQIQISVACFKQKQPWHGLVGCPEGGGAQRSALIRAHLRQSPSMF